MESIVTSVQRFFQDTLNALHITEHLTRIPQLSLWLLGLAALLSLLCCFFGYRHRNLWFAGICLIFGNLVGVWVHSKGLLNLNLSIAVSLLVSALFVFTYQLAPAELTFTAVGCFLYFYMKLPLLPSIIPAAILMVIAMFLKRWVLTILTAFFGALAIIRVAVALEAQISKLIPSAEAFLQKMNAGESSFYICLAVLTLLGFLVQAEPLGNNPLFHISKKY